MAYDLRTCIQHSDRSSKDQKKDTAEWTMTTRSPFQHQKWLSPLNRLIIDAVCNASPLAPLAQPTEHHSSLLLLSLSFSLSFRLQTTAFPWKSAAPDVRRWQHATARAAAKSLKWGNTVLCLRARVCVFPRPCARLVHSPRCSRRVKSLIDTSACADSEDRPRDGRSEPRRCKSLQFNHSLLKPVYNWAVASCCPGRGQKTRFLNKCCLPFSVLCNVLKSW